MHLRRTMFREPWTGAISRQAQTLDLRTPCDWPVRLDIHTCKHTCCKSRTALAHVPYIGTWQPYIGTWQHARLLANINSKASANMTIVSPAMIPVKDAGFRVSCSDRNDRQVGPQTDRQADRQKHQQTVRHITRQTDRQINGQ